MGDVINLDNYRPENTIIIEVLNGDVHLIPESLIIDIINGDKSITELHDWEEIVKVLLIAELESIEYL